MIRRGVYLDISNIEVQSIHVFNEICVLLNYPGVGVILLPKV